MNMNDGTWRKDYPIVNVSQCDLFGQVQIFWSYSFGQMIIPLLNYNWNILISGCQNLVTKIKTIMRQKNLAGFDTQISNRGKL